LGAEPTTLLCEETIVTKSKEMKTGCNLAESSKEHLLKEVCFANDGDGLYRPKEFPVCNAFQKALKVVLKPQLSRLRRS
jgi:hypothetical protein